MYKKNDTLYVPPHISLWRDGGFHQIRWSVVIIIAPCTDNTGNRSNNAPPPGLVFISVEAVLFILNIDTHTWVQPLQLVHNSSSSTGRTLDI